MNNEIWKSIPGYEGLYEASNLGRIRSIERITSNGRKVPSKIRTQSVERYCRVTLFKDNIRRIWNVHRLIYLTFKGEIPQGMVVNHIDENTENNRPENLNIMTQKENTNWGTGIKRRAEKQKNDHRSKAVAQLDNNGQIIKVYPSINEMHRQTGYGMANILRVIKNGHKSYGFYWKRL